MFPDSNDNPFAAPQQPQDQQFQQPVQQQQTQPQQYEQPQQFQQPAQQQPAQQQSDYEAAQGQPVDNNNFGIPQPNEQYGQPQFENQSIEQGMQQPEVQQQPAQQQPQQPAQQPQAPQQEFVSDASLLDRNFEEWLNQEYPMPELPKISDIAENDPEALNKFFDDYARVSEQRIETAHNRREATAAKEEYMWNEVYTKYPNLRRAPSVMQRLKQMHAGSRSIGQNFTPLQITDAYAQELNGVQQRGYQTANQQVQIRQSQPAPNQGGGDRQPAQAFTQQDMDGLSGNSSDVVENAASLVARMRQQGIGGFN